MTLYQHTSQEAAGLYHLMQILEGKTDAWRGGGAVKQHPLPKEALSGRPLIGEHDGQRQATMDGPSRVMPATATCSGRTQ